MSGGRAGGPTCGSDLPLALADPLADGTLMRWLAPRPRPMSVAPPAPWVDASALMCPVEVPRINFLFNTCREPRRGISGEAFADAARELGIDLECILAVAEVESPRGAFEDHGRPSILFERHYFHRLTSGKFANENPDISNPVWGGHGKYRAQYGKLERAYKLSPGAALQSASWGRFQIMGEHYALLGYPSPQHMVADLAASEEAHLRAFVRFVKAHPAMLKALRNEDWAGFARRYNGPDYKKNDYDTKLAEAYKKFKDASKKKDAPPPAATGRFGPVPLP